MYSFWQAVANTPWWVFAIYCYLIWISFLASKPRVVSIRTFFLIPSLMLALLLVCSLFFITWSIALITIAIALMLVGTLAGWLQFTVFKVKVLKDSAELFIPGNFVLLGVILIAFVSQYFYEAKVPLSIEELQQPVYGKFFFSIYGFLIGLLLGKWIYVKWKKIDSLK